MVEITSQISALADLNRSGDSRVQKAVQARASKIQENYRDLADLIDLSESAVQGLEDTSRVVATLELYRDAYDAVFGNTRNSFGREALKIFEDRKGDVEKIIQNLEKKNADLNEFFKEQRKQEKFTSLARDISQAKTQGQLSFLKAKVGELRQQGGDAQADALVGKLERLIVLKERGEEGEAEKAYAAFIQDLPAPRPFPFEGGVGVSGA